MQGNRLLPRAWKNMLSLALLVTCLLVEAQFHPAWAVNLRATPYILLTGGWDSNIQSTVDNQVSDGVFHISPGLSLSTDMLQTTFVLSGSLAFEYYIDNPDLNTYTRNGVFGLTVARPIQATQKLTITPDARYFKQNDLYVRNSSILGSPSTVVPSQAYPVTSSTLTQISAGLGVNYDLSGASRVVFSGVGTKDMYSSPGLLDTTFFQGNLAYENHFSVRSHIGPFIAGTYSTFSNGQVSRIYTGGLVAGYQISDFHSVSVRGGASRWNLVQEDGLIDSQVGWEPYAQLDFRYETGRWHATVGGSYQTQGVGGFQAVAKTISGSASLLRNITQRWSVVVGSSYQKDISVSASNNVDYYVFNRAGILCQVTENISANLTGTQMFTHMSDVGGVGGNVQRTNVFLGFDARKMYTIF